MKANEYFKKHGYKKCKAACAQNGWLNTGFWIQLKRLVESHENLFLIWSTVQEAKKQIRENKYNDDPKIVAVYESWIKDVESCQ